MNGPIVIGSQFDGARGIALVAASRKHEDRQARRLAAGARQSYQRIHGIFARAKLDDEQERNVAGEPFRSQGIETGGVDAIGIEFRERLAHQRGQSQAKFQIIVHDQAAAGGAPADGQGGFESIGVFGGFVHWT